MPNLRDIRNHITSVQSIAKVTRALEVVSGVKGRRLQDRVESTYGFADRSWQVLNHLA
ncbi:MAG: F0F1 ATP synthase subunit gamma, partial [Chloroflexi bacterium]|nr:F0F1 ATP synthase subunit gamma [Chloroflexota bacterium]